MQERCTLHAVWFTGWGGGAGKLPLHLDRLLLCFFFVVLKTLTFPFLAPIRGLKSDDTNADVEWWENVRKVEADSTGVSKSVSVHVGYFRSLSHFTFSDSKTGNWMC